MTELSAGMAQHRPTTSGLLSEGDWQQFFAGYSHIVLVANSDEQNFCSSLLATRTMWL